jgi:prevent-host-death family protein
MEFISIRDFRNSSGKIWDKVANDEDIIITNHGRPTAILVNIPNGYFDETVQSVRRVRHEIYSYINANQDNINNDFSKQRILFYEQRPKPLRQKAWAKFQAAFTNITDDMNLDDERNERLIHKYERIV